MTFLIDFERAQAEIEVVNVGTVLVILEKLKGRGRGWQVED